MTVYYYISGLGTGMLTSSTIFPGQNLQVHNTFYTGGVTTTCLPPPPTPKLGDGTQQTFIQQQPQQQQTAQQQPTAQYYFAPLPAASSVNLSTALSNVNTIAPVAGQVITAVAPNQPIKFQSVTSHSEVSQVSIDSLFYLSLFTFYLTMIPSNKLTGIY